MLHVVVVVVKSLFKCHIATLYIKYTVKYYHCCDPAGIDLWDTILYTQLLKYIKTRIESERACAFHYVTIVV